MCRYITWFPQLVESEARREVLLEENRALSKRVSTLQEELLVYKHQEVSSSVNHWKKQAEKASKERDQAQRDVRIMSELVFIILGQTKEILISYLGETLLNFHTKKQKKILVYYVY